MHALFFVSFFLQYLPFSIFLLTKQLLIIYYLLFIYPKLTAKTL